MKAIDMKSSQVNSSTAIKNLIRFLDDVFTAKKIKRKEPYFFKLTKDLDDMLHKYYISFTNNTELREQVAYNYNLIKDMSFPDSKERYIYVKDLSNHSKPNYSNGQYNSYALFVHSYLMRKFGEKLNKVKNVRTDYENPYPEYFNSYGYEVFVKYLESFKKNGILLAPMSFLVDHLKKDGLVNKDKTNISVFNFISEDLGINMGKALKFKTDYGRDKYLPSYNTLISSYKENK
tara:strand:+ start:5705 stop:6403 length:699 start_codon:yes stop_codon:yes gene_type:complete